MNCPYCHRNIVPPITHYGNPYTWFGCDECKVQFRTGIRQLIDKIIIYLPSGNFMYEVHLCFDEAVMQKAWVNVHPFGSVNIPLELANKLTLQNAEDKIKTFLVFS